jgi:hypothetical protein
MLTKLHIIAGEKTNDLPTITYLNQVRLVLQICFIDSGLKKRKYEVIRYDRGKWFSESSKTALPPEFMCNYNYLKNMEKNLLIFVLGVTLYGEVPYVGYLETYIYI